MANEESQSDSPSDADKAHQNLMRELEVEKLRLEISDLKSKQRWALGSVGPWIPFFATGLLILGGWLTNWFNQERIALSRIRDAYERDKSYAQAVTTIGDNGGQIIVSVVGGTLYHEVTFSPIHQSHTLLGNASSMSRPEDLEITPDLAASIVKLSPLDRVDLSGTRTGDADVAELSKATIRHLDLSKTAISDVSLASLAEIRTLWSLNVCDTEITEYGIAQLAGHPGLNELSIAYTSVFLKDSAKALRAIPNLKRILVSTPYDDDEFEAFNKSLPSIKVMRIPNEEEPAPQDISPPAPTAPEAPAAFHLIPCSQTQRLC